MLKKKYTENDVQNWCKQYEKGYTLAKIASLSLVSKSTIRTALKKHLNLRPKQQKGRIPWNKGKKTGQKVWNKDLRGSYPYVSPNKAKLSPFKGIARL